MEEYIPCFACGAKGLNIPGETHRYMLSSPGCWAMYNEVLEKEYSDFQYAKAHHFTVDAYACQHPGEPGSTQASRSVWIHLSSLFMIFNYQMPLQEAANFKSVFSQFEKRRSFIHQLEVPEDLGKVTVFDVWNNEDASKHYSLCEAWATSAFEAWKMAHSEIKSWIDLFLKDHPDFQKEN